LQVLVIVLLYNHVQFIDTRLKVSLRFQTFQILSRFVSLNKIRILIQHCM